jgi:ribosome-associated protein
VRAIADNVLENVRILTDRSPLRTEGAREQQWVLIDYGDVVVHVFAEEQRRFYEIERLYKDVIPVEWRESVA